MQEYEIAEIEKNHCVCIFCDPVAVG